MISPRLIWFARCRAATFSDHHSSGKLCWFTKFSISNPLCFQKKTLYQPKTIKIPTDHYRPSEPSKRYFSCNFGVNRVQTYPCAFPPFIKICTNALIYRSHVAVTLFESARFFFKFQYSNFRGQPIFYLSIQFLELCRNGWTNVYHVQTFCCCMQCSQLHTTAFKWSRCKMFFYVIAFLHM